MIKAVLFDMDGVIIDTETEYNKQAIKTGKSAGIELTIEEMRKYSGIIPLDMWTELKEKYRLEQDPKELAQRELSYMEEYYKTGELRPFTATLDFLKDCVKKGLKAAVATSSVIENAQMVINRLGISEYIGAISTSCKAGKSKPAPDIFLLGAELLGVKPEECVVIEDAKSGVQAAKAAGMKVIALLDSRNKEDMSAADLLLKSLSEINVDVLFSL